ncbi:unnamed protein product [Amoebophrya sp. A120]|nr:unnamed protein product [Amoebophrya sp. A120]|eukprot:GSA120T00016087001.1
MLGRGADLQVLAGREKMKKNYEDYHAWHRLRLALFSNINVGCHTRKRRKNAEEPQETTSSCAAQQGRDTARNRSGRDEDFEHGSRHSEVVVRTKSRSTSDQSYRFNCHYRYFYALLLLCATRDHVGFLQWSGWETRTTNSSGDRRTATGPLSHLFTTSMIFPVVSARKLSEVLDEPIDRTKASSINKSKNVRQGIKTQQEQPPSTQRIERTEDLLGQLRSDRNSFEDSTDSGQTTGEARGAAGAAPVPTSSFEEALRNSNQDSFDQQEDESSSSFSDVDHSGEVSDEGSPSQHDSSHSDHDLRPDDDYDFFPEHELLPDPDDVADDEFWDSMLQQKERTTPLRTREQEQEAETTSAAHQAASSGGEAASSGEEAGIALGKADDAGSALVPDAETGAAALKTSSRRTNTRKMQQSDDAREDRPLAGAALRPRGLAASAPEVVLDDEMAPRPPGGSLEQPTSFAGAGAALSSAGGGGVGGPTSPDQQASRRSSMPPHPEVTKTEVAIDLLGSLTKKGCGRPLQDYVETFLAKDGGHDGLEVHMPHVPDSRGGQPGTNLRLKSIMKERLYAEHQDFLLSPDMRRLTVGIDLEFQNADANGQPTGESFWALSFRCPSRTRSRGETTGGRVRGGS